MVYSEGISESINLSGGPKLTWGELTRVKRTLTVLNPSANLIGVIKALIFIDLEESVWN